MEIVIENPSESQTAQANTTVAAAAAAAVSAMSETPTTTTTMAAMSETSVTEQPTTTTTPTTNSAHPPFHRSPHCAPLLYGSQSPIAIPDQDYYMAQRSPRPLSSIEDFDEVTGTAMRRVDRSGLLEISSLEPSPSSSSSSSSSRYRHCRPIGAESNNIAGHAGTLPRRVDRSGLLEALPELPENRRGPEDVRRSPYGGGIVNRHSTVVADLTDRGQEGAMMKPDVVALVRSPTYDSTTSRFSSPSPSSSLTSGLLRPPDSPSPVGTTSRLSPTANLTRRGDGDSIPSERAVRFRSTDTFLPPQHVESSVGLPGRSSYVDTSTSFGPSMEKNEADGKRSDSPEKNDETKNETSCELSQDKSTETENDEDEKEESEVPRGERAEAEGCENTQASENLEEGRVPYNASNNKLYHNDNVQTLTVIILSEQL